MFKVVSVKQRLIDEVACDFPVPVDSWSTTIVATDLIDSSELQRGISEHGTDLSGISAHFRAAESTFFNAHKHKAKKEMKNFDMFLRTLVC